jgi:chromate transport protein ChrA
MIAIVVQALWRLGQGALKTTRRAVIALLVATANFPGMNELVVLCGAGVITGLVDRLENGSSCPEYRWSRCSAVGERRRSDCGDIRVIEDYHEKLEEEYLFQHRSNSKMSLINPCIGPPWSPAACRAASSCSVSTP